MIRKTTDSVPKGDIAIAKERWIDFKRRMDSARRTTAPGSRPRYAVIARGVLADVLTYHCEEI